MPFITRSASASVTDERILADEYGLLYIDGGAGASYQPLRFGSHWEYEYNPQAGVMTMVGGGNDSGTLTSVSDSYAVLAGCGASISSTNNAVWLGVNAASDKGGFVQPMRGLIVITTLAAVDELRGYFGCWTAALSGVGDSPSNGDGWAVSIRNSDLELISRDGTTLSGRTKVADLSTATTYWIEYYYRPGVSISARVHTVSGSTVTSGAWVSHADNLPRTNLAWSIIGCWAPTAANSRGLTWHRMTGYDVAE